MDVIPLNLMKEFSIWLPGLKPSITRSMKSLSWWCREMWLQPDISMEVIEQQDWVLSLLIYPSIHLLLLLIQGCFSRHNLLLSLHVSVQDPLLLQDKWWTWATRMDTTDHVLLLRCQEAVPVQTVSQVLLNRVEILPLAKQCLLHWHQETLRESLSPILTFMSLVLLILVQQSQCNEPNLVFNTEFS